MLHEIVTVNEYRDVMQKDYYAKGKMLYMCFVDLEIAFDSVQSIN